MESTASNSIDRRDFVFDHAPPADGPRVVFSDGKVLHPGVITLRELLTRDSRQRGSKKDPLANFFAPTDALRAFVETVIVEAREKAVARVCSLAIESFGFPLGLAVITYKLPEGGEAYAVACRPRATVVSAS